MITIAVIVWVGAWLLLALLIVGGAKLSLRRQTRTRGMAMLAAAALMLLMNVMIWTV